MWIESSSDIREGMEYNNIEMKFEPRHIRPRSWQRALQHKRDYYTQDQTSPDNANNYVNDSRQQNSNGSIDNDKDKDINNNKMDSQAQSNKKITNDNDKKQQNSTGSNDKDKDRKANTKRCDNQGQNDNYITNNNSYHKQYNINGSKDSDKSNDSSKYKQSMHGSTQDQQKENDDKNDLNKQQNRNCNGKEYNSCDHCQQIENVKLKRQQQENIRNKNNKPISKDSNDRGNEQNSDLRGQSESITLQHHSRMGSSKTELKDCGKHEQRKSQDVYNIMESHSPQRYSHQNSRDITTEQLQQNTIQNLNEQNNNQKQEKRLQNQQINYQKADQDFQNHKGDTQQTNSSIKKIPQYSKSSVQSSIDEISLAFSRMQIKIKYDTSQVSYDYQHFISGMDWLSQSLNQEGLHAKVQHLEQQINLYKQEIDLNDRHLHSPQEDEENVKYLKSKKNDLSQLVRLLQEQKYNILNKLKYNQEAKKKSQTERQSRGQLNRKKRLLTKCLKKNTRKLENFNGPQQGIILNKGKVLKNRRKSQQQIRWIKWYCKATNNPGLQKALDLDKTQFVKRQMEICIQDWDYQKMEIKRRKQAEIQNTAVYDDDQFKPENQPNLEYQRRRLTQNLRQNMSNQPMQQFVAKKSIIQPKQDMQQSINQIVEAEIRQEIDRQMSEEDIPYLNELNDTQIGQIVQENPILGIVDEQQREPLEQQDPIERHQEDSLQQTTQDLDNEVHQRADQHVQCEYIHAKDQGTQVSIRQGIDLIVNTDQETQIDDEIFDNHQNSPIVLDSGKYEQDQQNQNLEEQFGDQQNNPFQFVQGTSIEHVQIINRQSSPVQQDQNTWNKDQNFESHQANPIIMNQIQCQQDLVQDNSIQQSRQINLPIQHQGNQNEVEQSEVHQESLIKQVQSLDQYTLASNSSIEQIEQFKRVWLEQKDLIRQLSSSQSNESRKLVQDYLFETQNQLTYLLNTNSDVISQNKELVNQVEERMHFSKQSSQTQ